MVLSHKDLLECCVLILNGFDDEVSAIENHVERFFAACEVVHIIFIEEYLKTSANNTPMNEMNDMQLML